MTKKLPEYTSKFYYIPMTAYDVYDDAGAGWSDAWGMRNFLMLEEGIHYIEALNIPELTKECKEILEIYKKVGEIEERALERIRVKMVEDHQVIHPNCRWWCEQHGKDIPPYPDNITRCECSTGISLEDHLKELEDEELEEDLYDEVWS